MPDQNDAVDADERMNNILATGALYTLLNAARQQLPALKRVVQIYDHETSSVVNQIDIELSFMNSPYRLTVERVVVATDA